MLYKLSIIVLILIASHYLGRFMFYHCCPKSKLFSSVFSSRLTELRTKQVPADKKNLANFYASLSDE